MTNGMRKCVIGKLIFILSLIGVSASAHGPVRDLQCPWGERCTMDRHCITDSEGDFQIHRQYLVDDVCYSPKLRDGGIVYPTCVDHTGDYPSSWRIGSYWSYSERAWSAYEGPACEKLRGHPNGPTSVWTHLTYNRTLRSCARMYRCGGF